MEAKKISVHNEQNSDPLKRLADVGEMDLQA
jgi:hypothetical protein